MYISLSDRPADASTVGPRAAILDVGAALLVAIPAGMAVLRRTESLA